MTPEQMMIHRTTANMIRNSSNSNTTTTTPLTQFYPNPYSHPFFPTNTSQISGQGASSSAINTGLFDGGNPSSAAMYNF